MFCSLSLEQGLKSDYNYYIKGGGKMLKAYKRLLPSVLGVGFLLVVAYSCRYIAPEFIDIGDYRVLLSTILSTVRNIIHIALLLFWCVSIRKRIVDTQIRHFLLGVGILMVSWVFVRAVKFEFTMTNEDVLGRYIWYYYYIPMILIPLVGVYIVHLIGKPEGYKLPDKFYLLLIPAFIIIGLIFTNDIHRLAFEFPNGINLYNSDYKYGIIFYITFAWFSLLGLYFVIMLLKKSRVPGSKAFKSLPIFIMCCFIVFWVFYGMGIIKGDLTTIDCIIITLLLESAVIVKGCLPIEYKRHASRCAACCHSIRRLNVDVISRLCRHPWIFGSRIILVPLYSIARPVLASLLGITCKRSGQRSHSLQGQTLGNEVELLGKMDVSVELVCRSLEKISCRNDRIRVLDIRLSLLRKSVFRKTRIVPVRDRLHDICRIVCREHHRRSHIHIGKEITYRDSTISICSRTRGDSGRTSYLERELCALCHVKVQIRSVVDSLEVECGIFP